MKTKVVLFLFIAAVAAGAVTLEINGTAYDSIALKVNQSVAVQVVSDDASVYSAYVGFDDVASILGSFTYISTLPEAGNLANVQAVTPPPVKGSYVSAAGASPAPSAGIHFMFSYLPTTIGTTTLYIYASDATTILDTVNITIEPAILGNAFTYQGRLLDNNIAAEGIYDIQFKLYDSPTEGIQLSTTVDAEDVDVVDGYFITELDFGSTPYNDNSVWLEMSVRDGESTSPHEVLLPRQRLTPSPYALYAVASSWYNLMNMPAGFADGVDNIGDADWTESGDNVYRSTGNVGIGTTTPSEKLHVDGNVNITNGNIYIRNGKLLRFWNSSNALYGNIYGWTDQLRIQADSGGDVAIVSDAGTGMIVKDSGNVGIGTTSPTQKLDVSGTVKATSFVGNGSALTGISEGLLKFTVLNVTCGTLSTFSTSYTKIKDIGTFNKTVADSTIELTFNGRIAVYGTLDGTGAKFEVRIDNAATGWGRARAAVKATEIGIDGVPVSITGMFTGLSSGNHTVSIWVSSNSGTGTNASLDPGCWSTDHIVIKELK